MIKLKLFKKLNIIIRLESPVVPTVGSILNTCRGKYVVKEEGCYIFSNNNDKLIEVELQVEEYRD